MRVRDYFNRTLLIDAFSQDAGITARAIERIERFKPVYLHGYVSPLYALARRLADSGRRIGGIRAIVTDSEKLYDFQKEAMQRAFECPIIEQYGCLEAGVIAARDPRGVMRINEDHVIVERLEGGEAAITSLSRRACPFIRYKNGDLIELDEQVAPSLPYRSISSVTGRAMERIALVRGGHVNGFVLIFAISPHLSYIRRFQIHQTKVDEFKVRCVVGSPLPGEVRQTIVRNFPRGAGRAGEGRVRRGG